MMKRLSAWICVILPFFLSGVIGKLLKRDVQGQPFKLVCYWNMQSVSREGDGQFLPKDIDPTLCTHLVLSSARLGSDDLLNFNSDFQPKKLQDVFDLKLQNQHLKILLGIDDLSESSRAYLTFQDFSSFQNQLLASVQTVLHSNSFDGIDVDISSPDIYGKTPDIKINIISLLKGFQTLDNGPAGLILTVLASGQKVTADTAYDIPGINNIVDFTNLKSFDYHGGPEKYTALNAPLYSRPTELGADKQLNADWTVKYWLNNGATRQKLVLGIASFGRTFTLKDPAQNDIGAPVIGYGNAGPYLKKAGIKGYNELCDPLANNGWTIGWESHQQTPFATKDNQWIGYDDVGSIEIKAEYANENQLAGAMLWTLDTDDFRASCGLTKYPLLAQLHQTLGEGDRQYPDPNPGPAPKPTFSPFHPVCREDGYFANPEDCTQYYRCVKEGATYRLYNFICGPGTFYNEKYSVCDWPYNVPGCEAQ